MPHCRALGVYNNYVYALAIPLHFGEYNIAHLEMVNLAVALKIWGHLWVKKRMEIHCDNGAVVAVLSFGRARNPATGDLCQECLVIICYV